MCARHRESPRSGQSESGLVEQRGRLLELVPLASLMTAGCISGSLASSTGPRPPGLHWSDAPRQQVHVGETVTFDFVLQDAFGRRVNPTGVADYCLATIGSDQVEAVPDAEGRFQFSRVFADLSPGQSVEARAAAHVQRGRRDYVEVRGRWLRAEGPSDDSDEVTASGAITLIAYQSEIDLRITRPADDLDPETGLLRIRRDDGQTTTVYLDRPHRPGFSLDGPDAAGYYHARYRPAGSEVNPVGTTAVEFVVNDRGGRSHRVEATIETP